jgi:hypothetical protein
MILSKSSSPWMILIYVEIQLASKYYKGLKKRGGGGELVLINIYNSIRGLLKLIFTSLFNYSPRLKQRKLQPT